MPPPLRPIPLSVLSPCRTISSPHDWRPLSGRLCAVSRRPEFATTGHRLTGGPGTWKQADGQAFKEQAQNRPRKPGNRPEKTQPLFIKIVCSQVVVCLGAYFSFVSCAPCSLVACGWMFSCTPGFVGLALPCGAGFDNEHVNLRCYLCLHAVSR